MCHHMVCRARVMNVGQLWVSIMTCSCLLVPGAEWHQWLDTRQLHLQHQGVCGRVLRGECLQRHTGLRKYLHTGLRKYLYTGLRKYLHTGLRKYLHTGLRKYLHTGLRKYLHTGLRKYLHTGLRKYLHTGLRKYLHTGLRKYLHTGLRKYLHTGLRKYLHTGLHKYLHLLWESSLPTYSLLTGADRCWQVRLVPLGWPLAPGSAHTVQAGHVEPDSLM